MRGHLLGGEGGSSAKHRHLVTDLYAVDVAHVQHQLIHTHPTEDGGTLTAEGELHTGGAVLSPEAVGVADGHGGDAHLAPGGKGAAVADGGAGGHGLDVGDHGFKTHSGGERQRLAQVGGGL